MTLKSRLEKLERSAAAMHAGGIRRPADVPEQIWQRAMELLAECSPAMLRPWTSLQDVAQWCRDVQPEEYLNFPDPILHVVIRALAEAETGELPPDWITSTRDELAHIAEIPDEELAEIVRVVEIGNDCYHLPPPYVPGFLDGHAQARALALARKLERGEITPQEHAAELATFLPPVTRADLENAARKFWELYLECVEPPEAVAKAAEAMPAENATAAGNPGP